MHVECKPDEQLLHSLGHSRKNIKHHNDKGRVCNELRDGESLIGMVDEDPGAAQPKYFNQLRETDHQHNIKIYNDPANRSKLIVICPRLEDWIIKACQLSDIKPSEFGFSNKPNELHKNINFRLEPLGDLIRKLIEVKSAPVMFLRKALRE